jgi:hypothetical protein
MVWSFPNSANHVAVDMDVVDAITHFIMFGLNPGSFATAVILRDYDLAYMKCHETGKSHIPFLMKLVKKSIPDVFRSRDDIEKWSAHEGLSGAPSATRVLFKFHGWYNTGDDVDSEWVSGWDYRMDSQGQ